MSADSPSRRAFLKLGAVATVAGASTDRLSALIAARQAPAPVTASSARPSIEWGVQSGDVAHDRAIVWSRSDRPARMVVDWSTTDSFADARQVVGPAALEPTDFTAAVDLQGLPAGQRIFYRVRFQDLTDLRTWSEPAVGQLVTPIAPGGPARDVSIAFTADTCGQGWGIDAARGGMRIYESMRQAGADLLVFLGDLIYADQPLSAEVTLDDGSVWRNLVTPEKSRVAETLADYRGNFRYNLLDGHVRAFNASTAQLVIWDDHEVRDNWYPTQRLERDPRYREKSVALLSAFARTAFLEYTPTRRNPVDPERIYRSCELGPLLEVIGWDMRSYRGANSTNTQPALTDESSILGRAQLAWVKQRLASSGATWKVIASDMPIGLIVPDYPLTLGTFEAVANRDDGAPLGRELEIADLLRFIRERHIRNVVFVTADVHYGAVYHYAPERAKFAGFDPFYEFVAGPAHAGTFGPNPTDATFGPKLEFLGIPDGMKPNRPPSDGWQFFGTFSVDAKTKALTAKLHKQSGEVVFTRELPPAR